MPLSRSALSTVHALSSLWPPRRYYHSPSASSSPCFFWLDPKFLEDECIFKGWDAHLGFLFGPDCLPEMLGPHEPSGVGPLSLSSVAQ